MDKDAELMLQSFKNLMIASGKITGKVSFRLLNMSFNQTAESIFKSGSNIASTILRDAPSYLAVSVENDVTAGDSALTLVFTGTSTDNEGKDFRVVFKKEWLEASENAKELSSEYSCGLKVVAEDLGDEPTADDIKNALIRISDARNVSKMISPDSVANNENLIIKMYSYDSQSERYVMVREDRRTPGLYGSYVCRNDELVLHSLVKSEGGKLYSYGSSGRTEYAAGDQQDASSGMYEAIASAARKDFALRYAAYYSSSDGRSFVSAPTFVELKEMEGYNADGVSKATYRSNPKLKFPTAMRSYRFRLLNPAAINCWISRKS